MKFINIFIEVLKKFGDFKTRSSRAEFWTFFFMCIIISFILGMVSHTVSSVFSLVILVPSLAVGTRRLHDIGKSGWTQLWILTIVGIIYLIILWAQEGENTENKWGQVPKNIEI